MEVMMEVERAWDEDHEASESANTFWDNHYQDSDGHLHSISDDSEYHTLYEDATGWEPDENDVASAVAAHEANAAAIRGTQRTTTGISDEAFLDMY